MYRDVVGWPTRRVVFAAILFVCVSVSHAASVTLFWDASTGPNVASYTLRYGTSSRSYPNTLNVGNTLTASVTNLTPGTTYYFAVTARNTSGVDSDPSSEVIFLAPGTAPPNQPPTLAAISNIIIGEDSGLRTVSLSGISSGSTSEAQTLTVTASSSNTGLLPNPTVSYASPNTTGSLSFSPVANASGTATITVTVNDGQSQSNTVTRAFTVTVNPANDAPTLNSIANLTLNTNAGLQTIALSGIGSGAANESQTLTVTATHNNAALLGALGVNYSSPSSSGSLSFTPVNGAVGSATVTVTVSDGGPSNNVVSRSFVVNITAAATATIFVEAESGTLVSPMTLATDANASNGRYIYTPTDNQGTASYAVNIPQAGNYWVWCRILSTTNWKDSFFVAVDGGTEDVYNTAINLWSPNWQWTRVNGNLAGNPWVFALGAGTHTFAFRGREASTLLDALYISNDPNFVPTGSSPNQPPTLNSIANLTINEDATQQTVSLSGIGSGSTSEAQTLTVTASSSNPSLIPSPTVTYASPNATGSLSFRPAANASGIATITVTVNDGQAQNNTVTRSFTVTVLAVNDAPLVSAGSDTSVTLPALLTLGGAISDDGLPLPALVTATWSKVSGPGTVTFVAPGSPISIATFSAPGQYVLRLTATDGALTASDDVTVGVLSAIDTTGPVVSGLVVDGADARTITLAWQTDEPAACSVEYGPTSALGSSTAAETNRATAHLMSVRNLQPGSTVYLRVRSTDAAGNVSFTTVATAATPAVNIFSWAAEAGALASPMAISANAAALDASCISSPISGAGSVSYPVQVSATSDYKLWCRVWSPAAGVGSFYVAVDGGGEDIFDSAEVSWRDGWQWVAVNGRNGAAPLTLNPRPFDLAAGPHTFSFRANEAQTMLDEVILSNDPDWTPGIQGNSPALTAVASSPTAVNLSWTNTSTNETGFQLQWSRDGILFSNLITLPPNTVGYVHNGLASGSTNHYRIYAFNDSDRTDFSNVAVATTGQPPSPPASLTATLPTRTTVRLTWIDQSTNESGFIIERSTDNVTFAAIQTVGANVTTTTDVPPARTRYYYRIRATNGWGTSAPSPVATVRLK